jgi:hypothetical protein
VTPTVSPSGHVLSHPRSKRTPRASIHRCRYDDASAVATWLGWWRVGYARQHAQRHRRTQPVARAERHSREDAGVSDHVWACEDIAARLNEAARLGRVTVGGTSYNQRGRALLLCLALISLGCGAGPTDPPIIGDPLPGSFYLTSDGPLHIPSPSAGRRARAARSSMRETRSSSTGRISPCLSRSGSTSTGSSARARSRSKRGSRPTCCSA